MTVALSLIVAWSVWQFVSVTAEASARALDWLAWWNHARDCYFCEGQPYPGFKWL